MPEAQDVPETTPPPADPGRRRRRHRRRPLLVRYWWLLPTLFVAVAVPFLWVTISSAVFKQEVLPGYISSLDRVEQEYLQLTGKTLQDTAAERQFDLANQAMLAGNYSNAAIILEEVSKKIAVPAVFNDIGVLYMSINDPSHAVRAFRDALARDHDYGPVRANIKRLNLSSAEPSDTELEPNNNNLQANPIWLDRPVRADISPGVGDVDSYWFVTSRPPRDHIVIEVTNRSTTLLPHLRVYDAENRLLNGLHEASNPGGSVRFDFGPPPNSFFNIQVDGANGTFGAYVLTVTPLHAYDLYEPNDELQNATRIVLGQAIEANIMDQDDTDFFSFLSPSATSLTVDVVPRDKTLIPGLSTFAPDKSSVGEVPDVDQPGSPLHFKIQVQPNQLYTVQVWGKNSTAGAYFLQINAK